MSRALLASCFSNKEEEEGLSPLLKESLERFSNLRESLKLIEELGEKFDKYSLKATQTELSRLEEQIACLKAGFLPLSEEGWGQACGPVPLKNLKEAKRSSNLFESFEVRKNDKGERALVGRAGNSLFQIGEIWNKE